MEDMVLAYMKNNFVCACFTDHDYFFYILPKVPEYKEDGTKFSYSEEYDWKWERAVLDTEKINKYFAEGKRLQEKYKYPVICGIEISCGNGEEACLFGEEACREWFNERCTLRKVQDWKNASFKKYNYALNWNHPHIENYIKYSDDWTSQFHTIEIVNNAQQYVYDTKALKSMLSAKHVRALDAHSIILSFEKYSCKTTWSQTKSRKRRTRTSSPHFKRPGCCSFVNFSVKIKNEDDLIKFMRESKQSDWLHKGEVEKERLGST